MNTHQINRRHFLWGTCALAATSVLPKHAYAKSDYVFTHGEFQITVLSDGFISIPGDIMVPDVTAEERAAMLSRLDAPGGVIRAKSNIPLIRKGNDLILVDIGAGHKYQPSDGGLADNLQTAGTDPAAITKVVFTHGHPDHIWATLAEDGSLRFPNATYYVGASEWNFWMDPDYLTTMPAALHEFAKGAQRDLGAIKSRVVMLKPGDDVITGLSVFDTPGHTPGHLSLELAGHEGLLITADVANNEIVSFEHPDWKFGYDTIPELAIRNRIQLLDRAATDKVKLLGYHWEYPGVGYAERMGSAFHFVSDI
jgi:glyoxylase-like metal-dependent hydrolase (beta-lactamase superfamily II)